MSDGVYQIDISSQQITSSSRGRVQSFVYDLNPERGIVRVRVASVPRSTEVQPGFVRFDTFHYTPQLPHTYTYYIAYYTYYILHTAYCILHTTYYYILHTMLYYPTHTNSLSIHTYSYSILPYVLLTVITLSLLALILLDLTMLAYWLHYFHTTDYSTLLEYCSTHVLYEHARSYIRT